ncbi:MAG: DUF4294 domain-containing protein [Bacteroidota bacterium]
MQKILSILILLSLQTTIFGQFEDTKTISIDGHIVRFMVDEKGDTIFLSTLDDMSISSPREFANREEYRRYRYYQICAAKVYPYAKEAIRIFRSVEQEASSLNKRKRKKFMKKKTEELKEEFEEPLKKLTKIQGKILVKMIEKELDTPMYDLIKNLRGTFTASYWNTFSKFFGHRLKDGYVRGEDHILDAVLDDLDISY